MADIECVRNFLTRFARGFVLALHEIPPERLTEFVESIHPSRAIPLPELVQRSKDGRPTGGLFAITVDDGVGENVRELAELFIARQWPATFYLPVGYVETGMGMAFQWWRMLKPLLPRKRLELRSATIDLSNAGALDNFSRRLEAMWHSERLETYFPMTMELVNLVARERRIPLACLRPAAPIRWDELGKLAANDLIRFESHGVSHAAMSTLTDSELETEMETSRDTITERVGRPCRHLAYPFGSPASITPRVAAIARRFYDSAVTMTPGSVDYADPWLMPRIAFYRENSVLFGQLKIVATCCAVRSWKSKERKMAPAPPLGNSPAPVKGGCR